jgi:hypothetical protein
LFAGREYDDSSKTGGCAMTTDDFRKIGLIGLSFALTLTGGSGAQNANTGEIKGTVTDNSGAVVPGAKVTITNLQAGITTVPTSNSAGIYDAPSVPTGAGFPDGSMRPSKKNGARIPDRATGATLTNVLATLLAPLTIGGNRLAT